MSSGRSGGCLDTVRKECGQSMPKKKKIKPDAGRTTTADIQQRAFLLIKHTHAAFTTAGADQCRKSEVSRVCMSVVCVSKTTFSNPSSCWGVQNPKGVLHTSHNIGKKARHGHKHDSILD